MAGSFFNIEMLPARHGDCLWIEYGNSKERHRILIDGGPVSTFDALLSRISQVPSGERGLELVVLTHVDADHVEGLVRLFAEKPLPVAVRKVWFNGWRQMNKSHKLLGPTQGEFLSALLVDRLSASAWDMDAAPLYVPAKGPLPSVQLDGGMSLTLLSPNAAKLKVMSDEWRRKVAEDRIDPGDLDAAWDLLAKKKKFLPKKGLLGAAPDLDKILKRQFKIDPAKANGSSIAVLAEYEKKSALLLGDAHPDVVCASIRRLCANRGVRRLQVEAVKVSHHGSKANTSEELLKVIESPAYLISTNGDQFRHPDKECVARIIRLGKPKSLWFNYDSKYTKPWISHAAEFGYDAVVRDSKALSLVVSL
jgi:hypothetical protein